MLKHARAEKIRRQEVLRGATERHYRATKGHREELNSDGKGLNVDEVALRGNEDNNEETLKGNGRHIKGQ